MEFAGLDATRARDFAERRLPAWSGNRPELLASFYTDDAFYSDPAIPAGVRGREALLAYFRRLLAHNPDWVWTQRFTVPLEGGFLNFWHAKIPVGARTLEVDGVCTVQMREGRIARNEVFFTAARCSRRCAPSARTGRSRNAWRPRSTGPTATPRATSRARRAPPAAVRSQRRPATRAGSC